MWKRFFAIICCVIIFSTLASCGKKDSQFVYYPSYKTLCSVDEFVCKLQAEEFESKEFYVLVPQYYVGKAYATGFGLSVTSTYQVGKETNTRQGLVMETFSVCNEERYGKQITDWGQYAGVAVNFNVSISINVDYSDKITDLKFEYYSETSRVGLTIIGANVYNGKFCIASLEVEGYDCSFAVLKSNIESYVREFLMLKSEFLKLYERGGVEESFVSVEELTPNEKSRLWENNHLAIDREISFQEWKTYCGDSATCTFLKMKVEGSSLGYSSPYNWEKIVTSDEDEEGNYKEPFLCQYLQSRVKEFCDNSHNDQGNIRFSIVIIPIPSTNVDLSKVIFEWWSNSVVNLYYEDYLFATATFSVCDDCTKDVTYIQACIEEFITVRIAKVN